MQPKVRSLLLDVIKESISNFSATATKRIIKAAVPRMNFSLVALMLPNALYAIIKSIKQRRKLYLELSQFGMENPCQTRSRGFKMRERMRTLTIASEAIFSRADIFFERK